MTDFTAGLTSPDPAHLPVVAPFIQERLRNDIIEALRGGVTPTAGIPYVWVNRNQELLAEAVAAIPVRSGSEKNRSYFPLTPQRVAEFDWLAVLNETPFSRGGRPFS